MINWFGPQSWESPVCETAPRCDIPVGVPCARCSIPIADGASGVTMPGSEGPVAFHLNCHLKSILPHTVWPAARLVPEACDGLVDGVFACASCGMFYQANGIGWVRRVIW